jgi:hypothetical protein
MSDEETVLGKRARNGKDVEEDQKPINPPNEAMDDSDDDVGPMPMPASTGDNGAVKKKRKGSCPRPCNRITRLIVAVLKHSLATREIILGSTAECRSVFKKLYA